MALPHPDTGSTILTCRCGDRGYVRALEEDDWGFPAKVEPLAETPAAHLGRCRHCGTWWERLPHWVYGYAWYRTEQGFWDASTLPAALATWTARRQNPEF
jgi:hypothetical protein